MKYSKSADLNQKAKTFVTVYKTAAAQNLDLHAYSKKYLENYLQKLEYSTYLACHVVDQIEDQSVAKIIDIGGGIGFNTAFFSFIGFSEVIYLDIDEQSTSDAKKINDSLGFENITYKTGDYTELKHFDLSKYIVCSRDVIEHVYDLADFVGVTSLAAQNIHNTAAILNSVFRRNEFNKIHHHAEYSAKSGIIKNRDQQKAYLQLRQDYISKTYLNLNIAEVEELAIATRGLVFNDIDTYLANKNYPKYHLAFLYTNTCDPTNGNWAERVLSTKDYSNVLKDYNKTLKVSFTDYNSFKVNPFKLLAISALNLVVKLFKTERIAPAITLKY